MTEVARVGATFAEELDGRFRHVGDHEVGRRSVVRARGTDRILRWEPVEPIRHPVVDGFHVLAVARLTSELRVRARVVSLKYGSHLRKEVEPHELHALGV